MSKYRCPDWFADAKLGFWAHWGPQSVGLGGWYAKAMYDPGSGDYQRHIKQFGHPSKVGYKDVLPLFTADKFDPDGLMAEFKEMGARLFLAMGRASRQLRHVELKISSLECDENRAAQGHCGSVAAGGEKHGLRFGVSEHLVPSYDWWNPNKMSDKTGSLLRECPMMAWIPPTGTCITRPIPATRT